MLKFMQEKKALSHQVSKLKIPVLFALHRVSWHSPTSLEAQSLHLQGQTVQEKWTLRSIWRLLSMEFWSIFCFHLQDRAEPKIRYFFECSTMKMQIHSSETSINIQQSTKHNAPGAFNLHKLSCQQSVYKKLLPKCTDLNYLRHVS